MRILIFGGRDFTNYERVEYDVKQIVPPGVKPTFICGLANGADMACKYLHDKYESDIEYYEADWGDIVTKPCVIKQGNYGPYNALAGYIRNQRMLDEGEPDVCIGYWDGISRGTKDMVNRINKANIPLKLKYYTKQLSIELCRANPDKLYLFGDNLIGKGKKGQACIRDSFNSLGIPTKRLPSMSKDAFFSDKADEFEAVNQALAKIKNQKIVIPHYGLGTGLAQMEKHSPKLYDYMNQELAKL